MYHEIKWGLPVRENLDYETRRRLIYEKRDVHKPMNPWAMEQLVNDITGQSASIRDSNDDLTIPTNTFLLRIDCGEPVNLAPVIAMISKLKQAHVQYDVHVRFPEAVSLFRVGAAGSIVTRLSPAEQPDAPPKPHTVHMGSAAQTVTHLAPVEQRDAPPKLHTVHVGSTAQTAARLSPAEQPDNLAASQTVRMGGTAQTAARLPPMEQPDPPPKPRTVRTGSVGTFVTVLRGRVIDG